jgi:hypothetical protein
MSDLKWQVLDEVAGNIIAELIRSYLEAYQIPVLLSQEGAGHFGYAVNVGRFGRVQILVPTDHFEQARQLLEAYHSGSSQESNEATGHLENDEDL